LATLITGATGFIGQRLINAVDGEIRVLSREKYSDFETVILDLQSSIISDDALDGIDTIFHLAGFAHDMHDASKIADL
jgi:UDP-glucose 4-epimerase